jgi:two-component system CheB/CheR fusion protein
METGNESVAGNAGKGGNDKAPLIVAIGASAGGVQALQSFFKGISANTGAAFIVVVHLDPQHRSELSSIVASRTQMPVVQVESTASLEPNHVYVIPPDRRLQVIDHTLSATEFDRATRAKVAN